MSTAALSVGKAQQCRNRNVNSFFGGRMMKTLNAATIYCVAAVLVGLSTTLNATPIVDGRFDPDEGYTLGHYVNIEVEGDRRSGNIPADDGVLWMYRDLATGDLFANLAQPLTLVDNSYGDNSIGWGSSAPSGKDHKFRDLKGSDKAQFTITDADGNILLDFIMDYFSKSSSASSGYASLGVSGGDGKVNTGSASSILAWATSLDYNFNTLGHALTEDSPVADDYYITADPAYSDWVYEVIYEFRVDGAIFQDNGFGELTIPVVHDSPNKIGKNHVYIEINGPVPEPATVALLGLGSLALLRKRRKPTASSQ